MKITITDCKKSKDYNRVGNAIQSKWSLINERAYSTEVVMEDFS